MKIQDITKPVEEAKQRLDPKCWDGYKKQGTKIKGGVKVNNCVPESKEDVAEGSGVDAFAAGHDAFRSGTTKNPYKPGSDESRQWDLGWETSQSRTWNKEGVAEGGFKNTYNVGDRVDGPLGAGTIVAVSKNVNADGRVKVKLDDPSRAGEDGKYKDSFVLDTTQLTHINESVVAEAMLEETYDGDEFFEAYGELWYNEDEQLDEAEYQGRSVPLGKPMQGDVKKFKVYVKDPSTGNVKKVNFGDPNMTIKKSNPARRRSFRARHNCDNPGPRTSARYWSCRKW